MESGFKSLKAGSPILSYYLVHICNLSLASGVVPQCWKRKRVTPLYKNKGDVDDVNNYRPISILPICMNVFEKIVHVEVSIFLDENKILSVSDFVLEEVSKGRYVGAVLIDLKKAFDTVDHKILLKKLFVLSYVRILSIGLSPILVVESNVQMLESIFFYQ